MKLLTKDLEEKLKEYPLGSQDGKLGNSKVIAKFFNPTGVGTWYIIEGKLLENGDAEMFGYCNLGDDELAEFGTVMLSELESIQLPMGMTIERDLYIPKEIDLMQALKRDGYQVPDYIKDSYIEQINQKPEIYGHESIIICNPKADTNALKKEYKNYIKSISKNVEVDNIGLRKLAYEIKGLKEGYYLDFKYETDKNKIADIEKKFRTDDRIVKFLTVRLDPVIDDRVAEFSDNTNSIKILRGNIISYVDGLKQRVQEKLINEYNDFISELKNENPQVILERAYEKVCKQEIVYTFERTNPSANECKALLKCPNILNDCYDEWLKSDDNFNELLEYAIENSIKHITEDFKRNQKKKDKESR